MVKEVKQKEYFVWCPKCNDALESCNEVGTEAQNEYYRRKIKANLHYCCYCFGCDKIFFLEEVKDE